MVNLLIVESPKKAKTIQGYLGPGWVVRASFGHIRDLPSDQLGVEPPNFRPQYVVAAGKSKNVLELKAAVASAAQVYLATDPDREGEAIAWHLKTVLGVQKPHRVKFNAVTQKAVQEALKRPETIDNGLVRAQEARRVVDRLVGYRVSETLRVKSGAILSAGRVQSVALKLVVELEAQILRFKAQDFFKVHAHLEDGTVMDLDVSKLAKDGKHLFSREIADQACNIEQLEVVAVSTKPREVAPRAAFTTSTLQQAGNALLKASGKQVMEAAQHLFESGFITYHRTDDCNMSEEGYEAAVAWLKSSGMEYQRGQRRWPSKPNAQEAHECIRPTDFALVTVSGSELEQKVYALIRERALMSQMPSAVDEITTVVAVSGTTILSEAGVPTPVAFVASGAVQLQAGWRAFKATVTSEEEDEPLQALTARFKSGDVFHPREMQINTAQTQPPKRYTEGSLVKKLEALGIGRPSTYATIMGKLVEREYVRIGEGGKSKAKDMRLFPSEVGMQLVKALSLQTFMDYDYTSRMEKNLDLIAQGKEDYLSIVRGVYQVLEQDEDKIEIERVADTRSKFREGDCPGCGQRIKRCESKKQKGQFFWVHVAETEACSKFLSEEKGKPVLTAPKGEGAATTKVGCPRCGQDIVQRRNSTTGNPFWVHVAAPATCSKYINDRDGKPVA